MVITATTMVITWTTILIADAKKDGWAESLSALVQYTWITLANMMIGKALLSGLWVCPECRSPVFFTLDHVSLSLFHCGSSSHHFRGDPALSVFASKCQDVMSCRDGCSLWSRGSWLGGFVASCTLQLAHCDFVVGSVVVYLFMGLRTWHISCHLHAPRW